MKPIRIDLPDFQFDYWFKVMLQHSPSPIPPTAAFIMPEEQDKFVPFGLLINTNNEQYQPIKMML